MKSGKLLILLAMLALVLGVLAASAYAAPPGPDTNPQPAGQDMPDAALGTAPAGAGIMSVGTSTVTGVNPTLLPPGSPFDMCFTVFVQSPDAEYLDHFEADLPDGWTVNSVAANSVPPANGCSSALPPVVGVNAGNVVYWQSTGYPPQTGCGAWNGSTAGANFDFCVNITIPDCTGEPWSFPWNYIGDGYGGAPHSVAGTVGPVSCLQPGVYLTPEAIPAEGCGGEPQVHTFQLYNNTGADGSFDMAYSVPTANGTLTGPPIVQVANGATAPFDVILTPDQCLDPGVAVTGLIQTAGNGYSDQSTINKTILSAYWSQIASEPNNGRMDNVGGAWNDLAWSITGYGADANVRTYDPATDSWTVVGTPAPFGTNYARSGCQFNDVVVMYGDAATAGFTGLWAYDMGALLWTNLAPSGNPPPQTGIWAPAWAADPETGYCYMTGGATTPGAGNLTTVYVYDPGGNAWLAPLPNFTSVRDFHAAFVFRRSADNHKLLCVAGGNNGAGLASTQCYDFDTGAWNAENADMGTLPADLWAMGYTVKLHAGTDPQLWLTGGVNGGSISTATEYYDVNSGTWQPGGSLVSGAVYRTAAVTLNNEVYHLSGSIGSFTYTGLADRHIQCPVCLYGWEKYIDGEPWIPGMEITRQTSDTIEVVEVLHLTPSMPPPGPLAGSKPAAPAPPEGGWLTAPAADLVSAGDVTAQSSPPAASGPVYQMPEDVLYDNGPLVTHPGGGSGGADASALQTALSMTGYGANAGLAYGYRIADDFAITDPNGWQVDQITFFSYQTGSGTGCTLNAVNYQIWNGPPNDAGSSVVFGDTTTNRMLSCAFSNIYRVLDTNLTNTDRPIMAAVASAGVVLPPGTYWVDYQIGGTLASGPWVPPISILGQTTTGNALQWVESSSIWQAVLDGGTLTPQGEEFIVEGTVVPQLSTFAQIEAWDPTKLRLLDWAATGGVVITGTGRLEWTGEIVAPMTITLTKWFHVEPCTWTETLLWEEFWLDQVPMEERPVVIHKLPPMLWIDAVGGGDVLPGHVVSFTLLFSNTGGFENDIMIRNDFPPGANFANAYPYPNRWDEENALWAEWDIAGLPMGAHGSIEVAIFIAPIVPPSTTFEIWDGIFDHTDTLRDWVIIPFVTRHRYVYLPLVFKNYTP
jgi:hypothetical protein